MEERTKRESNRRRRKEKWKTCWCCRDQQRTCRMAQVSAEKFKHTGPAEKAKSGLDATEKAVSKYAGAAFAKRKRNRAVSAECQIMRGERVNVSESRTLARKEEIRAGAWRREGGLYSEKRQVSRWRGRASKKSLSKGSRRKREWSGRKSSSGRSVKSWFHSKSGQICNRKRGWETKSPLIR